MTVTRTTVRFIPNPGFDAALLRSHVLEDDLKKAAEDIAEHAKAIAPVESGDYRDGIDAGVGFGSKGIQGVVSANDPASGYIEFGTVDTPTFAPLRRGAAAAGYRLRSS